ncbi:MAG: ABC transporter ATP-binding protein [Sulfuricurvum sp.]|jgi:ABC-type lipoprotein export system ATPase subunit
MIIKAVGLEHFYGHEQVLRGVDIEIHPGEFVAIVGESGSGKTTLLSILSTLLRPTSGSVTYDGQTLDNIENINRFRREHIGFVFQFHYLIAYLTLRENIALAALREKNSDILMQRLKIAPLSHRYSDEVSGGERQRAAIARALVNHPSVVFADEPTGNLDTQNALGVYELFREFSGEGTSLIVASHDSKIRDFADVIIVMEDGCVKSISRN